MFPKPPVVPPSTVTLEVDLPGGVDLKETVPASPANRSLATLIGIGLVLSSLGAAVVAVRRALR